MKISVCVPMYNENRVIAESAKTLSELAGERLKLFRVWGALDDSSRAQLKRVFSLIVGRKKQEKKKREIIIHEKRK